MDWREPEHRRDALIVLGLFTLGVALNVALGVLMVWLFHALGWWDVALASELNLGQTKRELGIEG